MPGPLRVAAGVLAVLLALPASARQASDPKAAFVSALGRFSLAVDGTLGDEGPVIRSSVDALERALDDWDTLIASYEAAMKAEIGGAEPALAARMHTALGGVYLDRSRTADAIRQFTAAEAIDPKRADVQSLLAASHSQLTGDVAAATEAFRTAADLAPDDPVRAYELARYLAAQGKEEEAGKALRPVVAAETLRAVLRNRPPQTSTFIRLGLVPERADLEPYFPPVLYRDAFADLRRGDYRGAIAGLRKATAADPLIADTGAHRALVEKAAQALREGAIPQAIEQLTAAVDLAPDRAEPRRLLGRAYAIAERYDEAIDAFDHAIRLDPRDERARVARAEALVAGSRFADADEALRGMLTTLPGSGRARYALARLYRRLGRFDDAGREFDAAAALEPLLGLNGIYETLGALHARQQNYDEAVRAQRRRVDLHPNDPDAHFDLGEMYLRQARHDDALAEYWIVLLLNPSHARAAASMAQVHLRLASNEAAAEAARRALELDVTHSEARYVLGTALIRLGRVDEGRRELESFQRQQASAAEARTRMLEVEGLRRDATLSAADGDHVRTVALLRKVLALETSDAAHLELGLALLDADQPAEAIEHLNEAARLNAPYHVHRYLAAAYRLLGLIDDSQRQQASYERIHREALRRRALGPLDSARTGPLDAARDGPPGGARDTQ